MYSVEKIQATFEYLKAAEHKLLGNPAYQELTENPLFMSYWNTFENANLSDKKATKFDVEKVYDELVSYVNDKLDTEYQRKVSQLKTEKGQAAAKSSYEKKLTELQDIMENHKDLIRDIVVCMNYAVDIKMLMWSGFKDTDLGYNTFYKHRTQGYLPASMEGVAMSSGPDIVKIVDRSVFSNANRDPDFLSGFEHD